MVKSHFGALVSVLGPRPIWPRTDLPILRFNFLFKFSIDITIVEKIVGNKPVMWRFVTDQIQFFEGAGFLVQQV